MWAGFHAADLNDEASPARLFLKTIGLTSISPIRSVAAMDAQELVAELEAFTINGGRPSLVARTHLRLAMTVARIIAPRTIKESRKKSEDKGERYRNFCP